MGVVGNFHRRVKEKCLQTIHGSVILKKSQRAVSSEMVESKRKILSRLTGPNGFDKLVPGWQR